MSSPNKWPWVQNGTLSIHRELARWAFSEVVKNSLRSGFWGPWKHRGYYVLLVFW